MEITEFLSQWICKNMNVCVYEYEYSWMSIHVHTRIMRLHVLNDYTQHYENTVSVELRYIN